MSFWNNKKKQQSNYKYILTIGVDSRTLELIFRRLENSDRSSFNEDCFVLYKNKTHQR